MRTPNPQVEPMRSFGLYAVSGVPWIMHRAHQHNDIEISFLTRGWMKGIMGGRPHCMKPGTIFLFWAAYPHWNTGNDPETMNYRVNLPLDVFLRFRLPTAFKQGLLAGNVYAAESGEEMPLDAALFDHWAKGCGPGDTSHRESMVAMLEARLMAVVPQCRPLDCVRRAVMEESGRVQTGDAQMQELLSILVRDFREEISLKAIALKLGLHPSRASRLFHRFCGMTCIEFLTKCRLAHAQNLLLTTERKILNIAMDSGFPSISQFYAAFTSHVGTTPQQFRLSIR